MAERGRVSHDTYDAALYLLPVAQCFLRIRRANLGTLTYGRLFDCLEVWCETHAPTVSGSHLHIVVGQARAEPYMEKADAIACRLNLIYSERQALHIRTIGACDVNKAERDKRARERKREAARVRQEKKRRAAGVKPRSEYLAGSLSQAKPWGLLGICRATYYAQGLHKNWKGRSRK